MDETQAFAKFHERLKLDPAEVAFARSFPDDVRGALSEGGVKITHSFLQGSLARGTMVSPLKDVDMVVCLDPNAHGHLLGEPSGPDQAMGILQKTLEVQLRSHYPDLRFGPRKAHALPIELGGNRPSFDLVPAFEATTDDGDVLIADRENWQWVYSNTRKLNRVVSDDNKATEGILIHVVRMIKHAVRSKLHEGFPSLVLESVAITALPKSMSYAEACLLVFEKGAEMLGGPIFDPTGRDNLTPKIDEIEPGFVARAKQWFDERAKEARHARDSADIGDHIQSIAWWFSVFGPPFPAPPSAKSPKEAAKGLAFGVGAPKPTRGWRESLVDPAIPISHPGRLSQSDLRMAGIGLEEVMASPNLVAEALEALECVDSIAVKRVHKDRIVFQAVLLPYDPDGVFISQNYPIETVNIVILPSGKIYAVPKSGRGRRWEHRNYRYDVPMHLCLWYPHDPNELCWSWKDGLKEYVRILARHLIYEEYCRRTGEWPLEDAPHGYPSEGIYWPIRTPEMLKAIKGHHRG